jgi:hypothetical protein
MYVCVCMHVCVHTHIISYVCVCVCVCVILVIKDRSDDISIGRAHACVYIWIMPVFMYVCRSACVYL